MEYLYVIGGLVLLGLGGEAVVRGAVDVSRRLGISTLLVGLFVVAFGTSSPELAVAIQAAQEGRPDIAVGNVLGSNIADLLLILALAGLISPYACYREIKDRDVVVLLAVTGLFVWLAHREVIGQLQGSFLVGLLILYIIYATLDEKARNVQVGTLRHNMEVQAEREQQPTTWGLVVDIAWLAGGIAALYGGSEFLVDGATGLARMFGVSEGTIGLSIVAVGTSLPELATVIVAAWRGHPEVAVGGIIGSNIFNILAVLGIAAMVAPITINPAFLDFDVWVMLGATLIFIPFLLTNSKLNRIEGSIMLLCYVAYIAVLYGDFALPF